MKEQPIETREHVIGHSIGQRPIHTTYEPPGPLPQFRTRPKLGQPQPAPKKRAPASATVKLAQNTSIEVPAKSETADAKKSS
ncbi:MAG: hypothetical protein OXU27_09055 [Candidatus Poribacteria bacterium]|nr:hypothetical protein [Candidatus Poribacteria bacterium]MDD9974143.1 hypothetical protein [Candidatus Poribacteria bacterium]MDE0322389.1 hypothetical protein [Candidatus Poribacteria bacterium]